MKKLLLFLLLSSLLNTTFGYSLYDQKCQDYTDIELDLTKCKKTIEALLPLKLPFIEPKDQQQGIVRELILFQQLHKADQILETRKEIWGDFTRYLFGKNVPEEKIPEYEFIYKDLLKELNSIQEVFNALKTEERRLRTCKEMGCSISWEIQLQDNVHALTSYYNNLLISNPMWLSEDFEKFLATPPESRSPKEYLLGNLSEGFKRDAEIQAGLSNSYVEIANRSQAEKMPTNEIMTSQTSVRHRHEIDWALNMSLHNWDEHSELEKKIICDHIKVRNKIDRRIGYLKTGAQIGLAGISFVPMFAGARLALSTSQILSLMGSVGFSATLALESMATDQKCKLQIATFLDTITISSYTRWKDCTEEVKDLKQAALISAIPVEILTTLPNALLKLRRAAAPGLGPSYISSSRSKTSFLVESHAQTFENGIQSSFVVQEGKHSYTFLNMSRMSEKAAPDANKLANEYLDFVGEVYVNQLKVLPKEKIGDFIKTSKEYRDRTKLIIVKTQAGKDEQIVGGIAAVDSKSAKELLPFEKSTGVRVPRKEGKHVMEVTRLTSTDPTTSHMEVLFDQLARITAVDRNLDEVFMYTSVRHQRLYNRYFKKRGIKGETVEKINDEEVIFKFTREELNRLKT